MIVDTFSYRFVVHTEAGAREAGPSIELGVDKLEEGIELAKNKFDQDLKINLQKSLVYAHDIDDGKMIYKLCEEIFDDELIHYWHRMKAI